MIGHQLTFDGSNNSDPTLTAEFTTLLDSLNQGEIDLIVTGVFGGIPRSFRCTTVSMTQASCQPDRAAEAPALATDLKNLFAAAGNELSFSAVPVGFGLRMGNDRDEDGFFNQDELDAGSDPADPNSTPGPAVPALGRWGLAALAALLMASAQAVRRRGSS